VYAPGALMLARTGRTIQPLFATKDGTNRVNANPAKRRKNASWTTVLIGQ